VVAEAILSFLFLEYNLSWVIGLFFSFTESKWWMFLIHHLASDPLQLFLKFNLIFLGQVGMKLWFSYTYFLCSLDAVVHYNTHPPMWHTFLNDFQIPDWEIKPRTWLFFHNSFLFIYYPVLFV
jgi:hypothetical protein